MDKNLEKYITACLETGIAEHEIRSTLLQQGWENTIIDQSLTAIRATAEKKKALLSAAPAPKKKSFEINAHAFSAAKVLLYLGGLVVIIAGITFVGTNWSDWSEGPRIIAIGLPLLMCFMAGSWLWMGNTYKKSAMAFLNTGAFLFPLFLIVLFNEMQWFEDQKPENFGLAVAFLTTLFYATMAVCFRYAAWTFFYLLSTLCTYYCFWLVIGIESTSTIAWLFLIPGTFYLMFAIIFHKWGKKTEHQIAYLLGAVVLVFAFGALVLEETEGLLPFLGLAVLGAGYFAVGAYIERRVIQSLCAVWYFIGAGVMFGSCIRIALEGSFINTFTKTVEESVAMGWSAIFIGILFYGISRLLNELRHIGLKSGVGYSGVFNFAAPLLVFGGLVALGFDGEKPFYETLLLLVSLAYIMGSIPLRSRSFLYFGTLFLVIYIFSMGSEYFQDEIGWPITLFVAGLLSMGIGITIERVRRKYFTTQKTNEEATDKPQL